LLYFQTSELNETEVEAQRWMTQVRPSLPCNVAIENYLKSDKRLLILVCRFYCLGLWFVISLLSFDKTWKSGRGKGVHWLSQVHHHEISHTCIDVYLVVINDFAGE